MHASIPNRFDSSNEEALVEGFRENPEWKIESSRDGAILAEAMQSSFWNVSPEIAIEVMSESDVWRVLCEKIDAYVANGVTYAVAIDCTQRRVYERGVPPPGLRLDIDKISNA